MDFEIDAIEGLQIATGSCIRYSVLPDEAPHNPVTSPMMAWAIDSDCDLVDHYSGVVGIAWWRL